MCNCCEQIGNGLWSGCYNRRQFGRKIWYCFLGGDCYTSQMSFPDGGICLDLL
jgi:hypothetical protein